MHPGCQDLNVIFLYLGHVANWMGDGGHFGKFPYSTYIFDFFLNIKMKKARFLAAATQQPEPYIWAK